MNQISFAVSRIKPEGFNPSVEVAGCYIEVQGKLLFLQRSKEKSEGGRFGVPAGKIEKGETPLQGVIRETFEEAGIALNASDLTKIGKIYVQKPGIDFVYHLFYVKMEEFPEVNLNWESESFRFCTLQQAESIGLMESELEALHHFKALRQLVKFERKPFYYIRHGQTDVNADPSIKRVDYDLPLNAKGVLQANKARLLVEKAPITHVAYSPIQRAVQTKQIVADAFFPIQREFEELSECKAAIWSNLVLLQEERGFDVTLEVEAFFKRAAIGLGKVLELEGTPLIVSHGAVHFALCYLLGVENHFWISDNCHLIRFYPIGEEEWGAENLSKSG